MPRLASFMVGTDAERPGGLGVRAAASGLRAYRLGHARGLRRQRRRSPTPQCARIAWPCCSTACPKAVCVELMQEIADLLVEHGLSTPEGDAVRSVVGVHELDWTSEMPGALHMTIPKTEPRSPDLGLGYSPN